MTTRLSASQNNIIFCEYTIYNNALQQREGETKMEYDPQDVRTMLESELKEHLQSMHAFDRQASCGFQYAPTYAVYHRREVERLQKLLKEMV